jgi:hypothetical protein
VRTLDGGGTFGPDQVLIRKWHRFEGVSDPDDMAIVYALESVNGTRGTLVDAFGATRILPSVPSWRRYDSTGQATSDTRTGRRSRVACGVLVREDGALPVQNVY